MAGPLPISARAFDSRRRVERRQAQPRSRRPRLGPSNTIAAPVKTLALLIPFVLFGGAALYIGFSGGPSAAREAYANRVSRTFRVVIPILYIALGVGVPALILANRGEAAGAYGALEGDELSGEAEEGKLLFRQRCASCHNLDAVNARGVTGPDLDEIGTLTPEKVEDAIENGGTGQMRMPAGVLEGEEAAAVATYVSEVAGR